MEEDTSTTLMDGGVLMIPIYGNNQYEYFVTATNGYYESGPSERVYIDGNPVCLGC